MPRKSTKTTAKKKAVVSKKNTKPQKVKLRFLNPPLGKYGITAEVGHQKEIHFDQAQIIIENGDAEIVE